MNLVHGIVLSHLLMVLVITARTLRSLFATTTLKPEALLYRKHICQKSRDDLINEELYQGISKGAEGYAARPTFKKAKEEGINIAIHWQDADSSSSNAMIDHFPDAEIMICGGHAGKAHKKQLENLAKKKSFTDQFKKKHHERFPQVDSVVCHCEKRHKPGCGCWSEAFIEESMKQIFTHPLK